MFKDILTPPDLHSVVQGMAGAFVYLIIKEVLLRGRQHDKHLRLVFQRVLELFWCSQPSATTGRVHRFIDLIETILPPKRREEWVGDLHERIEKLKKAGQSVGAIWFMVIFRFLFVLLQTLPLMLLWKLIDAVKGAGSQ